MADFLQDASPQHLSARAREDQRAAADPTVSAWVAANAGTGKTQVLTDRVLRLLLAGTKPEKIIALTYTKAAAAEMSKRVFDRLARWVTMDALELTRVLADLCGSAPAPEQVKRARQLFAEAIETPGGLRVQTIHAFSERLLQRFPLEAGVPPGFSILDDRTGAELRRAATDETLGLAATRPDTPLGRALAIMIAYAIDDQFDSVLREALSNRAWLIAMARLDADQVEATHRRVVGLDQDDDAASLDAALAGVLSDVDMAAIRDVFRNGGAKETKIAEALQAALRAKSAVERVALFADMFLNKDGSASKSPVTMAIREAHPQVEDLFEKAKGRFIDLRQRQRGLDLIGATRALITIADAVRQRYDHAKAQRAALDFDDLIRKAVSLVQPGGSEIGGADWVLFKLDGGIDHILVDEAQDTSPQQWSLIDALAQEFFSGGSRDDVLRTLFAVGDEKQSIYGFQGAAPEMFQKMGHIFAERAKSAGRGWRRVPLNVSFRTTEPILAAVDQVFADPNKTPGLTADDAIVRHIAHRAGQSGHVELWPIERPEEEPPANAWAPLDEKPIVSPVARLAGRIADTIAGWLDRGEKLVSENRPLRAGDILVLVSKRRPFTDVMVSALKARKVPVAGSDRLKLADQIAVKDLLVLAQFLTLPEDDLALATILKSPLFGLNDDRLIEIAPKRKGTLWNALLERAKTDMFFKEAADRLKQWRSEADFLPPYEFFASLLARDNGEMHHRLLTRLGAEAADPIDELLSLALDYDAQEPPSLQGFLTWVSAADHEIKRDMDQGRDEVRIMTVHGAKGLEAPIVFLPDTCTNGRAQGALLDIDRPGELIRDIQLWPVKGTSDLPVVEAAKAAAKQRDLRERNRLLYVALTRPRDRLYIAGFAGKQAPPDGCWYRLIERALTPTLDEVELSDGRKIRVQTGVQRAPHETSRQHGAGALDKVPLPAWATTLAPREGRTIVPLAPSRLAPLETDEAGEAVEPAKRERSEPPLLPPGVASDTRRFLRGTLTHALLEHLPGVPKTGWAVGAESFLDTRGAELPERMRASIASEVLAILNHPRFGALFGPESQAEVPVVAELQRPSGKGQPIRLMGQIDRLAIVNGEVLIIDYKTNRPPPLHANGVAEAYLLQLAAYRIAIAKIFPGHSVGCAILWTDGARLMEIDKARLDGAEQRLWELPSL